MRNRQDVFIDLEGKGGLGKLNQDLHSPFVTASSEPIVTVSTKDVSY